MSKIRIVGQLERLIQGLREKESVKKAELHEIQDELKCFQKSLEALNAIPINEAPAKKEKKKKANASEETRTNNPM